MVVARSPLGVSGSGVETTGPPDPRLARVPRARAPDCFVDEGALNGATRLPLGRTTLRG